TLLPQTGDAIRVGISGPPGVGKSTLIEALGLHVAEAGHRVAVLAVDPSSQLSGGSILGDKTRMVDLNRHPGAFIRPSPSGGTIGGVARRTREAMLLCEAAGYERILVETVGVGQSEVAVAGLADLFCVLVAPGGGDDLQGIKRGIMELADLLVVNKADGDLAPAAARAEADYSAAMGLMRPRWNAWKTEVTSCSALENTGISSIWESIERFHTATTASGELPSRRSEQALRWMWSELEEVLVERLRANNDIRARLHALERAVSEGSLSPGSAVAELVEDLHLEL
ncbi:MAG: methylmalonyl Co-A mutase-associated GTPase MeaB, partial [bacterium]|nr:methylmalonyl Co-A mutase-associated GTPase MeaB [bacterium]